VTAMKKEYNFSKASRGKFYVPAEDIEIQIYLDKNVRIFYQNAARSKNMQLGKMINSVLKKEMEIYREIEAET
jgi:hypothetical protein